MKRDGAGLAEQGGGMVEAATVTGLSQIPACYITITALGGVGGQLALRQGR